MAHFRNKLLAVLLVLLANQSAFAIPALGDTLTVRQPDGSTVKVRVWGDEFYRRVESLDGYTVMKGNDNWIYYAQRTRSGDSLTSTGVVYTGKPSRSPLPVEKHIDINDAARDARREKVRQELWGEGGPGIDPVQRVSGEIIGVTILIDFPDDTATIPVSDMEDFMNKPGFDLYGNNGSVRDYYLDMTGGKVDYSNKVLGYYRAQHPKSYYEDNNLKLVLIDEAYRGVDSIFDFTQVTYNIKAVKAVNILYAGPCNSAFGQGLWPHAGQHRFETDEGLILSSYQMAAIDTGLAIGPTIHENAHMLFNMGDLYDSKGDTYGIGYYCLMCYGCFTGNPAPINAYYREEAGWETSTDITDMPEGTKLFHEANSMSSYRFTNKNNSKESFYIESRKRKGRGLYTTDEGLMIWHVDEWQFSQKPGMTPSSHFKVSLEQADGNFDMELKVNPGDTTDLFDDTYSSFNSETAPSSDWWKDGASDLAISGISAVGDTMSFVIGNGATSVSKTVNLVQRNSAWISDSKLNISVGGDRIRSVELYSMQGKLMKQIAGNREQTMNINHGLSAGIYIVSVRGVELNNELFQSKLVVR